MLKMSSMARESTIAPPAACRRTRTIARHEGPGLSETIGSQRLSRVQALQFRGWLGEIEGLRVSLAGAGNKFG